MAPAGLLEILATRRTSPRSRTVVESNLRIPAVQGTGVGMAPVSSHLGKLKK